MPRKFKRTLYNLLDRAWTMTDSLVCTGLDPEYKRLPRCIRARFPIGDVDEAFIAFNQPIIDNTKSSSSAYKMNLAFYQRHGDKGIRALRRTIDYIRIHAPHALVILDAKYGDSRETNEGYADFAFGDLNVDVVTGNPYMGSMQTFLPFLRWKEKGLIMLCKSSNPDGDALQGVVCSKHKHPVYMQVALEVRKWHEEYGNCGLVVGATFPYAMQLIRDAVGDMLILAPGIGAQGGSVEETARYGMDDNGTGLLLSASRSIMYASKHEDFGFASGKAARKIQTISNRIRNMGEELIHGK